MSSPNNCLIRKISNHTEQLVQKINKLINENKKLKQEQKELSDFINNHIEKYSKKTFDATSLDNIELDMNSYSYFNTSLLFPNIKLEYNDFTDLPPLIAINKPIHSVSKLELPQLETITSPNTPNTPNPSPNTSNNETNNETYNETNETNTDNKAILKKIINNDKLIMSRPKTPKYNKKRPFSRFKKIEKIEKTTN